LNASANTQPILEPLLVEELKKSLEDSLFERLDRAVCLSQEQLVRLERENRLLREMRRLDLLKKYGPAGEKLSDAQLELLEQEPGVSAEEVQAESERAQLQLPPEEKAQASRAAAIISSFAQSRADHRVHARAMCVS
jgi:hypothetical protein